MVWYQARIQGRGAKEVTLLYMYTLQFRYAKLLTLLLLMYTCKALFTNLKSTSDIAIVFSTL